MRQIRIPRRKPDVGWQIQWMKAKFPQFRYSRGRWRGTLRPRPESTDYLVEIQYLGWKDPKVFVIKLGIAPDSPHLYPDQSLCLYYPPDWRWSEEQIIANTIVPWSAYWLFCYEYWLEEGEWYNEEAPHRRRKIGRR